MGWWWCCCSPSWKEGGSGQCDRLLVNNDLPHLMIDDRLMADCAPGSGRRCTRGAMLMMLDVVLHLAAWTSGGRRGNVFGGLRLESLL